MCEDPFTLTLAVWLLRGATLGWLVLVGIAEIAHAWRRRTFRVLGNVYTLGYAVSVFAFVFHPDRSQISSGSQFMVFYTTVCLAAFLISMHLLLRGLLLVCDLIGLGPHNAWRVTLERKTQSPRHVCLHVGCFILAVYVIITGPVVLLWVWLRFLVA